MFAFVINLFLIASKCHVIFQSFFLFFPKNLIIVILFLKIISIHINIGKIVTKSIDIVLTYDACAIVERIAPKSKTKTC